MEIPVFKSIDNIKDDISVFKSIDDIYDILNNGLLIDDKNINIPNDIKNKIILYLPPQYLDKFIFNYIGTSLPISYNELNSLKINNDYFYQQYFLYHYSSKFYPLFINLRHDIDLTDKYSNLIVLNRKQMEKYDLRCDILSNNLNSYWNQYLNNDFLDTKTNLQYALKIKEIWRILRNSNIKSKDYSWLDFLEDVHWFFEKNNIVENLFEIKECKIKQLESMLLILRSQDNSSKINICDLFLRLLTLGFTDKNIFNYHIIENKYIYINSLYDGLFLLFISNLKSERKKEKIINNYHKDHTINFLQFIKYFTNYLLT
jgi:hypothetical protein